MPMFVLLVVVTVCMVQWNDVQIVSFGCGHFQESQRSRADTFNRYRYTVHIKSLVRSKICYC